MSGEDKEKGGRLRAGAESIFTIGGRGSVYAALSEFYGARLIRVEFREEGTFIDGEKMPPAAAEPCQRINIWNYGGEGEGGE